MHGLPAANVFPPDCKSLPKVKLGKGFNLSQFFEVLVIGNPLLQLYKLCFITTYHSSDSMKTDGTIITRVDLRMRNYSTSIYKIKYWM